MSILCKNCTSGYILPGQPKGSLVNSSTESDAYYFSPAIEGETPAIPAGEDSAQVTTGRSSAEFGKKMAVVLLTDIFGLQLKNPKILADNFAKKLGCDVYVPDLFQGRYAVSEAELAPYIPDVPKTTYTIVDRIKHIWILVRSLPRLWATRPAVGLARTERFIKNLREKRGYSQIGVIGYCYGGGVCMQLAIKPKVADVIVACHPGPVWVNELRNVVTPLAVLCSEEDEWIPPAKRDSMEAVLKRVVAAETKVSTYKGTVHGFATRPNLEIPEVREAFESAFRDAVEWFDRHSGSPS